MVYYKQKMVNECQKAIIMDLTVNEYRQRILIVDDSSMNRELLIDMLSSDFEILEASNGKEAIKTVQEFGDDMT